ncbi:PAS domain-containing protein [Rhodospirillaceae bacterium SYSU D60014]|uniref:PAS domain-containing protein n=1 Tax=Virgifigura deserti TaxID=2268457 RepID=UPI0013C4694F
MDAYWHSLRGDRNFPAKRDIDPAEIKTSLPYINIAEIHGQPLRVRYRLVGTELCRVYNEDYTGKWLHETDWGPLVDQYEQIYRTILARRTPMFGVGRIEWEGRIITSEWGKWPLSADGITITHCLGMADYAHVPSSDPVMAIEKH